MFVQPAQLIVEPFFSKWSRMQYRRYEKPKNGYAESPSRKPLYCPGNIM